jgi:hypothetical protein
MEPPEVTEVWVPELVKPPCPPTIVPKELELNPVDAPVFDTSAVEPRDEAAPPAPSKSRSLSPRRLLHESKKTAGKHRSSRLAMVTLIVNSPQYAVKQSRRLKRPARAAIQTRMHHQIVLQPPLPLHSFLPLQFALPPILQPPCPLHSFLPMHSCLPNPAEAEAAGTACAFEVLGPIALAEGAASD